MLFEQEDVWCFFKNRKTDVILKSELIKNLLYFWQVQLKYEAVMHP